MGRSRLMQQQRARMEARRARLKKKKADMNKYGSGGKKATTRDTSKDVSKQVLKYGSGAKKGVTRDTSKDTKPAAKKLVKATTPKPAEVKPAKPSAQANKGSGRDGKFGAGTYGKGRPSDAKPAKKPSTKKQTRGGLRAAVNRKSKRDYAAGAREVSERARQMNRNPISIPDKPPKNPKEGDTYKKPFGPVMIYKNGKFVRK